ncbi:hypothetical protein PIB30_088636, partial [Stylosanthes scabra]|nr:hypothetical protein [Stylosanthes scabra]
MADSANKHTRLKSSSLTPAFKGDAGRHSSSSNHLRQQAPIVPPSKHTQHYIIQLNTPAHNGDPTRKKKSRLGKARNGCQLLLSRDSTVMVCENLGAKPTQEGSDTCCFNGATKTKLLYD